MHAVEVITNTNYKTLVTFSHKDTAVQFITDFQAKSPTPIVMRSRLVA